MLKFFHPNDPAMRIRGHPWYFVYLHGWGLENRNILIAEANGWEWAAPDLFVGSEVMPTEEGEYEALL